jgi:hypothetical protein
MTANGKGRKLRPRSDTERVDLLEKLLGFGRHRGSLHVVWSRNGRGGLLISHTGNEPDALEYPVYEPIAEDENGDLRALLDRAISKNAGAKKRGAS